MPVRNEEEYIRGSLQSLVDQSYPSTEWEIIVVDGRSSDRTRGVVEEIARQCPRVRLLDNPAGIVPTAMNIGIRAARGEIIIRADGHNVYPRDYASNCVKYLEQTGADNVGGPWTTVPADESFGAKLVAAILRNRFGVGNSEFRTSDKDGFVDTVPFGAFRREVFDRVGLFNEKLVRNQDNDLNARIRKAGGKIYLASALTTCYHPVKNFRSLLAYAFKTSRWHLFTLRQNKDAMRFRHMAPGVFVIVLLSLLFASAVSVIAKSLLAVILITYLVTGYYFFIKPRDSESFALLLVLPLAAFCFHLGYGAGTLFGFIHLIWQPSTKPVRPGLPVEQFDGASRGPRG